MLGTQRPVRFGNKGIRVGRLLLYSFQSYIKGLIAKRLELREYINVSGTTIAITVFSKWLKMHDCFLGIIATASKVLSSFFYALAPTKGLLYVGPVFDIFGNVASTAIRSLGTKIVVPEDVGG